MLAVPGAFAGMQCRQHADGAEHAAAKIADGDAGAGRRRAFLSGDRHAAAIALRHHIEGRALIGRAGFAEAGDGAGDDALINLRQRRVINAEASGHAGAEIAHHDIGLFDQLIEQRHALFALEVDANALFVAVEGQEIGAHALE